MSKTLFGKIINLHNIADFDHETSFHSVLFQVNFKENDDDDDVDVDVDDNVHRVDDLPVKT